MNNINLRFLNSMPKGPIRFDGVDNSSKLWMAAENLVDFGGKGHKLEYIDLASNSIVLKEDIKKISKLEIVKKVAIIGILSFTIIGGLILAGTILWNRNKYNFYKADSSFISMVQATCQSIKGQTIENYHDTLTDQQILPKHIKFMKELKLKDMYFGDGDHKKFSITNKSKGEGMEFSNRHSSMGELRGTVLRDKLTALKQLDGEMSLHDALTKLINSPENSDLMEALVNMTRSQEPKLDEDFLKRYLHHNFANTI